MKKKVLIALFVAVLTCVLAFSVSAANEVTLADGTNADLEVVFKVSGDTINGFNDGYTKNNIKAVVFPDSIATIKNLSFDSSTVIETVTFEASDTLILDGVSFNSSSIKKAIFTPECELTYKSGNFYNCKSLTEITFPKFAALPGNCFQFNSNMVPTNDIVFVEGITTLNCHMFNGCSKVGGTVVIPASVVTIKEGTFNGTAIIGVDFSKCVNLTSIGGGYGGTFSNMDSLTSLDFSACINLTKLDGPCMFEGSENLESVILPPNVTSIPHKTFAHCYKLGSLVVPATVTTIADESFHSARRGQSVMTFTMYIQSDVKLNVQYVFRDTGAKIEFVLIGDGITAEQFKTTNAGIDIVQSGKHSPLDNIEVIDYLDATSPWTFVPGQTRTSHVIVDNYCKTLALSGEHAFGENPCVVVCENCKFATVKENPEHIINVIVTYENGYANTGVKLTVCTNDGCPHKVSEQTEALFTCLGFSSSTYGVAAITLGYAINGEAITVYETLTNKSVKYGVFAVSQSKLGNGDVFDENGKATDGAIVAETSYNNFAVFMLKISGFKDEQKDAKLAMGAYVAIIDGENTEYSYMQHSAPNEGEKYCFISYNEVMASLPQE